MILICKRVENEVISGFKVTNELNEARHGFKVQMSQEFIKSCFYIQPSK